MSVYDQESPYNPADVDPRFLGEADAEAETFDLLELGQEIAELADLQRVFQSDGWPRLEESLKKRVRGYEDQLRAVRTMEAIHEARGAIRILEDILSLPENTKIQLQIKNEQYQETQAAP